jgi:hypothetical protein
MKKYYVHYTADFANTYRLFYAETAEDYAAIPADAEPITRKAALSLARDESTRRKDEPSSAYFADAAIYPTAAGDDVDWANTTRYILVNRIWERKAK